MDLIHDPAQISREHNTCNGDCAREEAPHLCVMISLLERSLTSAQNPFLKEIRRAGARGSLTEDGCMLAETFHLLDEALRSDADIACIIASESKLGDVEGRRPRAEVVVVPDNV